MNRREFLKRVMAVTATTVLPVKLATAEKHEKCNKPPAKESITVEDILKAKKILNDQNHMMDAYVYYTIHPPIIIDV